MQFCNINFNILHRDQLFERNITEPKCIVTVNAQIIVFANTNQRYMNYINSHYATFDGEIPLKKAKMYSKEFASAEKLSGSDIVYDFAQYAKSQQLKVFFLGGYSDSNVAAVKRIHDIYGIEIDGYAPSYEPYPVSKDFTMACFSRLELFKPDIVFIGFGVPKQEFFIEDNLDHFKQLGVKYIVGSGGTFEFVAGKIKRAPLWLQRAGFEGVYRLLQEFGLTRLKRLFYSLKFYKYIKHKPEFLEK